ncbi:MAG: guanylate kinase [Lachnospiraceae bacterium]|jgi:guanylate kinase|nr:guanylate kinase [Lachnospiraceae bacterium]
MSRIFVIMGKSATGKDTLYKELLKSSNVKVKPIVLYTTRPIRENESEGVEYHFVSATQYEKFKEDGLVIESRDYKTVHGIWSYFTMNDAQFDGDEDVLLINTLEGYEQIVAFFGQEKVVPLYVEVEDGIRLSRALSREREQKEPKYQELCRRFLADCEDFSEEKIAKAGIQKRFENLDMEQCLKEMEQEMVSC